MSQMPVQWVEQGFLLDEATKLRYPDGRHSGMVPVVELSALREVVEELRTEFWSYERQLCEQHEAGLTREQQTGAGIALDWVKKRLLASLGEGK